MTIEDFDSWIASLDDLVSNQKVLSKAAADDIKRAVVNDASSEVLAELAGQAVFEYEKFVLLVNAQQCADDHETEKDRIVKRSAEVMVAALWHAWKAKG